MVICVIPQTHATESSDTVIDCSTSNVNFIENSEWTHQEKLKAMNKAFYASVQRYELCQLSNQSSAAPSTSTNASSQGASSAANSELTGTETTTNSQAASRNSDDLALADSSNKNNKVVTSNEAAMPNGKIPEDILGVDNDDVIAAQIRLAAEIEKDSDKKAKLWNEYRKYKGLPIK